jgi:hypothetical protein
VPKPALCAKAEGPCLGQQCLPHANQDYQLRQERVASIGNAKGEGRRVHLPAAAA